MEGPLLWTIDLLPSLKSEQNLEEKKFSHMHVIQSPLGSVVGVGGEAVG